MGQMWVDARGVGGEAGWKKGAGKSQSQRFIQVGKVTRRPQACVLRRQAAPARMSVHDAGGFLQWGLESLRGWRPETALLNSIALAAI